MTYFNFRTPILKAAPLAVAQPERPLRFTADVFTAERRATLPHDRTWVLFYNLGPKIWEPSYEKFWGPKTCKMWRYFGKL